jgi:hypothetical protein
LDRPDGTSFAQARGVEPFCEGPASLVNIVFHQLEHPATNQGGIVRAIRHVALASAFLLLLARVDYADEFVITGGNITVPGPNRSALFTLTGDGFLFAGRAEPVPSSCSPCTLDQTTHAHAALTDVFSFAGQPGMFDGVDYPALFLDGILHASSVSFQMSQLLDSGTISVPFTASGSLSGFRSASDSAFGRDPIFSRQDFVGSGTVTATYSHIDVSGQPLFDFRSAVFAFEPGSTATPEPATLLLFGIGAGATAVARRRRRSTTPARPPTA